MHGKDAGGSHGWLPPALLTVVALVAATVLWFQGNAEDAPRPASQESTPSAFASPTSTESPEPGGVTPPPEPASPNAEALPGAGPPRTVVVESLGIDAPVVPISTQGTSLDPPDDPQVLGWWSGGAPVGAAKGTALVTGHTVNAGGGAMDDLEQVRKGADVRVMTPKGAVRYTVESVQVLDKDTLAREAPRLFSQQVAGRLVLVTCEDWDGTGYRSNVVVTAVPA